tara:strand:- start:44 stop:307 length:264 start_codon:yes stop_codon:yes gene_type:complete
MSQVKTQRMGRLLAAGTKDKIDDLIDALATLNALHIIEYDGSDDGFKLGTPKEESETVGMRLTKLRSQHLLSISMDQRIPFRQIKFV